jgi:hypothetical protein
MKEGENARSIKKPNHFAQKLTNDIMPVDKSD